MSDRPRPEAGPPTGGGQPVLTPAQENRLYALIGILTGASQIVNDPLRFYRAGSDDMNSAIHSLQDYCYTEIIAIMAASIVPVSE